MLRIVFLFSKQCLGNLLLLVAIVVMLDLAFFSSVFGINLVLELDSPHVSIPNDHP